VRVRFGFKAISKHPQKICVNLRVFNLRYLREMYSAPSAGNVFRAIRGKCIPRHLREMYLAPPE